MTQSAILSVPVIYQRLANADTPEESQQVEIYATLARQYAKETENYNLMVQATRLYYEARRKTTSLILPYISHGGDARSHTATLADFSITKQEWARRQKEYELDLEKVEGYFDECIANNWNPSIAGLLKSNGTGKKPDERTQIYNKAVGMLNRINDLTKSERNVLIAVTETFKPEPARAVEGRMK